MTVVNDEATDSVESKPFAGVAVESLRYWDANEWKFNQWLARKRIAAMLLQVLNRFNDTISFKTHVTEGDCLGACLIELKWLENESQEEREQFMYVKGFLCAPHAWQFERFIGEAAKYSYGVLLAPGIPQDYLRIIDLLNKDAFNAEHRPFFPIVYELLQLTPRLVAPRFTLVR